MKNKLSYDCSPLVNEYGSDYGWVYTINVHPGEDVDRLRQKLISDIIGEERYYSTRDEWDQIQIEYNYL
jgi:hypothetical protein